MIAAGDIEASRIPTGVRVARAEVLRLGRERIESETGRRPSDQELERLIDEVVQTNRAALGDAPGGSTP